MAEETKCFEILKQSYLHNHLTIFFTEQRPNCMLNPSLSLYLAKKMKNKFKFWCNSLLNQCRGLLGTSQSRDEIKGADWKSEHQGDPI